MAFFETLSKYGDHEEVIFCNDPDVGLRAIIAIHNTALGPALGGTRMWHYANEEDALIDVLRLSKGMTYKAAAAGLNLGGGKAVILADPKVPKNEGLFRAFGQFVNSLNGKYITAEDVGTTEQDMEYIFMETPWVTGIPKDFGGSGNPSPYTAHGILQGMKATSFKRWGDNSLRGKRIAVQGLGSVGANLIKYLVEDEQAEVVVSDIDPAKIKKMEEKYKVKSVGPDQILFEKCHILSPNALGAVINDQTIGKLNCDTICGGANNQLAESRHGDQLKELGILYAPDYVANAGGLMNVFVELEGYSHDRAFEKTRKVYDNVLKVFDIAEREKIGSHRAADRLAEERIGKIGKLRQRHQGKSTSRNYTTLKEVNNR